MADEIRNLLTRLKLEDCIEIFEKNKITIDILKHLSQDMISKLIPSIGLRAIFLSHWKKNYQQNPLRSIENNSKSNSPTRKKSKIDYTNEVSDDSSVGSELITENTDPKLQLYETHSRTVNDILQECVQGQRILKAYARQKELTEKTRNMICNMILTDFENRHERLDNKSAKRIANMIAAEFPSEVSSTYYISPIKKKDSVLKKSIPARGKIISMWRNRSFANKKLENVITEAVSVHSDINDVNDPEIEISIEWLKKNQVPWELVVQHWCKTFNVRRASIERSKERTLVDIFIEWPILKHPNGHSLIIEDFKCMDLSKLTLTMDKWEKFFQQIKSWVTLTHRDENANALIETLHDKNVNNDAKVALQIMILSDLIPPKKMMRCNKKFWKPFIWNAKDSMIKHAVIAGDVTRIREETTQKCKKLNTTIQPYIIVVEPSLNNIQNSCLH